MRLLNFYRVPFVVLVSTAMPPKAESKSKAKAKAKAKTPGRPPRDKVLRAKRLAKSNARRDARQAEVRSLNELANELSAASACVDPRDVRLEQVERFVRILEGRVLDDAQRAV